MVAQVQETQTPELSQKITDLILKLHAKATDKSVTQAEAESFGAKVQELLTRYGVELKDLEGRGTVRVVPINRHEFTFAKVGDRGWEWPQELWLKIARFFHVHPLFYKFDNRLVAIGKLHNVQVAQYVFHYLHRSILEIVNEERRRALAQPRGSDLGVRHTTPYVWNRSIARGCVDGIVDTLEANERAQHGASRALVVSERAENESWMVANMFVRSVKIGRNQENPLARRRGEERGRSISVNPGIGEGKGSLGLLK